MTDPRTSRTMVSVRSSAVRSSIVNLFSIVLPFVVVLLCRIVNRTQDGAGPGEGTLSGCFRSLKMHDFSHRLRFGMLPGTTMDKDWGLRYAGSRSGMFETICTD